MIYRHSFTVQAPLERVFAFHIAVDNLAALTPPPARVQIRRAPEKFAEGSRMYFIIWLGLLPVPWLAQFKLVSERGFTDRQVYGPFHTWVHRHHFQPLDSETTCIEDEIHLELRPHLLWGPVGLMFRLSLPVLFAYRAWMTRRLLQPGKRVQV